MGNALDVAAMKGLVKVFATLAVLRSLGPEPEGKLPNELDAVDEKPPNELLLLLSIISVVKAAAPNELLFVEDKPALLPPNGLLILILIFTEAAAVPNDSKAEVPIPPKLLPPPKGLFITGNPLLLLVNPF